ncbi:hypothetical protein [Agrobacterium fabrum]|uniref:hypothetical protein n=1 Tax=Agrobacterium fabrum TaxID=1176649 RepID=UPI0008839E78|nr:hypothetical protein [Agrobacterium fabrum]MDH6297459.1 hypothetical protein [Agrobacterium fabrum]WLP56503.1 hypothetical protein Q8X45_19925 [Agrobacterium fabrum]SDB68819.1 hypothetical protein SAMN03159422_03365 [Agrobacterium fabrum]SER62499.1 hypothetical protein SAMN03159504_03367 [Agrobacterium fabrum]
MARTLLNIWSRWRERLIHELDFYMEQAEKRILSQFNNIDDEAEAYANDKYTQLAETSRPEMYDMGDLAEAAWEEGIEYYEMLDDLRNRTFLSVAAGMYHEWDKQLREWLHRELAHSFNMDHLGPKIWSVNIDEIFRLFGLWGWDASSEEYFQKIDACRLIVNVYKHGPGASLESLKESYSHYLRIGLPDANEDAWLKFADHSHLSVTREYLLEFHAAFRAFWLSVPENIWWSDQLQIPDCP